MTRKILLTFVALIAMLVPTTAVEADDCSYNAAIAGECVQVIEVDEIPDGLKHLSQSVLWNGREAECAPLGQTQILCVLGVELPVNNVTNYIDANGNQCTNVRDAAGNIIAIACTAPSGNPAAPVPSFTG